MKIFIVFLLVALALADTCGGNCPSGKCPYCHCGYYPNKIDINSFCARHSWNQACCRCIITRESGGNANAMNFNPNQSFDVGIWQIN